MSSEKFELVLEKACSNLNASEMLLQCLDNEVITRETRNVLFQYKSVPAETYWSEFRLPSPLMIQFLREYKNKYNNNLDPRRVSNTFRTVVGDVLAL